MTDDADKVKHRRLLERDRDNHARAEFNDVLGTYSGRAVLCSILRECDIFADIPTDLHNTFRALGKRSVGLWLRERLLAVNSNSVILMENEDRKREADLKT